MLCMVFGALKRSTLIIYRPPLSHGALVSSPSLDREEGDVYSPTYPIVCTIGYAGLTGELC